MPGHCLQASQTGATFGAHARHYRQPFNQSALRHHQLHATLSQRTSRHETKHRVLTILAASSTDEAVRRFNDPVRSAQDLAEGVQSFLDDAQRELSTDEAPLPEHPIGEVGTINVAEGLDASVCLVQ